MATNLPPLDPRIRLVDENGYPTPEFFVFWEQFAKGVSTGIDALAAAIIAQAAAVTAQAAAVTAQTAVDAALVDIGFLEIITEPARNFLEM